jgi:hypothetical protein
VVGHPVDDGPTLRQLPPVVIQTQIVLKASFTHFPILHHADGVGDRRDPRSGEVNRRSCVVGPESDPAGRPSRRVGHESSCSPGRRVCVERSQSL